MVKRWKMIGAVSLMLVSLCGCQLTPKVTAASPPGQQLAQVDVPTGQARPDASSEFTEKVPFTSPKTPQQLLAEENPPKASPTSKRKKARNSDMGEFKRDYSELLKKPETLGFHPREEQYEKIIETIRNTFVENVKDDRIIAGLKKELKVLLDQAKVESKSLAKLDALPIDQTFAKIQELYGNKINKDLLGYVTMMGALDSLKDPYSVLMTPSETAKLKEQLQSRSFGGIGIYIEIDRDNGNQLTIFEPIEGTPAYKAGLESGDKILKIDGKPTKGITIDVAQSQIRGEVGSTVKLTILRRKETLEVPVQRGQIHVVSVTSKTFPGDIGYIRLRAFGADTAEELKNTLQKMKEQKVKGVILDLRNNGGGYIESAVNVVGEFAPSNTLVVYTIDRDKHKRLYNSTKAGGIGVPLVVMINEFSASASEITAGALRDHKIATLVGDHSFGKGSVQQLFPLEQSFPPRSEDAPQLKLTIARFYAPNGDVIDKQGIEPQVVVDMEPRFVGKIAHDVQLKKALELLGGNLTKEP